MPNDQFNRARIQQNGIGESPAISTVQVTFTLCKHDHPTRDEAMRCPIGGEFLFERTSQRLTELASWERGVDAPKSLDEVQTAIDEAMISVDPTLAEHSQWAQASARAFARGAKYDVAISHGDHLHSRFEQAIRNRLGDIVDSIYIQR